MTHTTIGGQGRPAAPPENADFEHPHPWRLMVDIPQKAGGARGVLQVQRPEIHLTPRTKSKKEAALELNQAREKSLSDSAEGRVGFEEESVLFSLGMTNA